MSWLDALGWAGSALLVYSLLQARVLRFRILNTVGCVVLIVFNALLGVWPMVGMNVVLAGINLWLICWLLAEAARREGLRRPRGRGGRTPTCRTSCASTARTSGDFSRQLDWPVPAQDRAVFLVEHGDETVGVVLLRDAGDGVARVELDYVMLLRFRDFTPGEFVYRRSGLFRRPRLPARRHASGEWGPYYDRLGFRRSCDGYRLDLDEPRPGGEPRPVCSA